MHKVLQEREGHSGCFDKLAEFDIHAVGGYGDWADALARAINQGLLRPLPAGRYCIVSSAGIVQLVNVRLSEAVVTLA